MNCIGFMVIMFVFLLYYFFSFFFIIFISIIILCLPFVANKRVHKCFSECWMAAL